MNKWIGFAFVSFVLLVNACGVDDPAVPPVSLRESVLTGEVTPLRDFHHYSVNLAWQKVPVDGFQLYRSSDSEAPKAIFTIRSEDGTFIDKSVKERVQYRYFLGRGGVESSLPVKVAIPQDFDSREHTFDPNRPINIVGYKRVRLQGRISTHRPITIQAEEIYANDTSLNSSAVTEAPKTPNTNGDDGQTIYVMASRINGNIDVFSHGQPGSPAVRKDGQLIAKAGKRGKAGPITVYAQERTDSLIRVWMKNAPSEGADPNEVGECHKVSIRIGNQDELIANCAGVYPSDFSGVYAVGTELFYLGPDLGLFKLKSKKHSLQFAYLGNPFSRKDGGVISYASHPAVPLKFGFGLGFDNDLLQRGLKIKDDQAPKQIYELILFAEGIKDLNRILAPEGLAAGRYFDQNVPLNMFSAIPWQAMRLLREHMEAFAAECKRHNVKGVQLRVSKDPILKLEPGYLAISNVPDLTIEDILAALGNTQ